MAGLDPLLNKRAALFWTLHAGGWLAYALSQYLGTLLYDRNVAHKTDYLVVITIAAISGFLLSLELRYVYRRLWTRSPRVIIGVALLSCYVFALIWRVIINSSILRFSSEPMEWEISQRSSSSLHDVIDVCAAVLDRHLFRHQVLRVPSAAARSNLARGGARAGSPIKMLRYQLNPHFLSIRSTRSRP